MTYDKGCVSYSPGPLNACCMHRNCIITVQLFISYSYQIDDLRDCSGFVVICSIFSWTWLDNFLMKWMKSFIFVLACKAKSIIDLINQTRHKTSSCISLFPTKLYILMHVHVAYIQDNDLCVLKKKVIYLFWKEGIIITQQHFNLFCNFFFPVLCFVSSVLTLSSKNTLEANFYVIFWN